VSVPDDTYSDAFGILAALMRDDPDAVLELAKDHADLDGLCASLGLGVIRSAALAVADNRPLLDVIQDFALAFKSDAEGS